MHFRTQLDQFRQRHSAFISLGAIRIKLSLRHRCVSRIKTMIDLPTISEASDEIHQSAIIPIVRANVMGQSLVHYV